MNWTNASLRGIAVFLYFVILVVWLPDFVIKQQFIAEASAFVRDLVVTVVWSVAFGGLFVLLRLGQRQGWV
jgi:hypothetical protein